MRAFPADRLPQELGSEYSAYTQFAPARRSTTYIMRVRSFYSRRHSLRLARVLTTR